MDIGLVVINRYFHDIIPESQFIKIYIWLTRSVKHYVTLNLHSNSHNTLDPIFYFYHKREYSYHYINGIKCAMISSRVHIWGLCCQKQVSQARISKYTRQFTVRCNYLSLPEIPASGNKVLISARIHFTLCGVLLLFGAGWFYPYPPGSLHWHWKWYDGPSNPWRNMINASHECTKNNNITQTRHNKTRDILYRW